MWFGYNPQFIFCHFSRKLNLVILGVFTLKDNGLWVPCVRNYSYSFMPISLKLHRLVLPAWSEDMHVVWIYFFRKLNLAILRHFYYQSE